MICNYEYDIFFFKKQQSNSNRGLYICYPMIDPRFIVCIYQTNRKLKISTQSGTTPPTSELRSMANCAGFDFVDTSKSSSIDVYVKLQDGYRATVVPFQATTLLAVGVKDEDYAYPTELKDESRKSLLFDGFNKDVALSQHFKISDFKHSERRFFRLDISLVDCLEMVVNDLGKEIRVIQNYAYRCVYGQRCIVFESLIFHIIFCWIRSSSLLLGMKNLTLYRLTK